MVLIFLLSTLFSTCYGRYGMENPRLFEGDLHLNPEQLALILGKSSLNRFAAVTNKWPSNIIAWDVSKDILSSSKAMSAINGAIAEYESKSCLKFVQRKHENAYLYFYEGDGCESPVGYHGKRNNIGLAPECQNVKTVLHEMFHSLGFYHEQSRPDRDKYVKIIWNNIPQRYKTIYIPGSQHNFVKHKYSIIDSMDVPYDYKSISHYRKDAFGSGRVTIETVDNGYQDLIGSYSYLSQKDVKQLNSLYRCQGKNTLPPTLTPPTKRPQVCEDENGLAYCKPLLDYCKSNGSLGEILKRQCYKSCGFCN